MKVLVTGANGQLAWELKRTLPEHHEAIFCSRNDLDISDISSVDDFFSKNQIEGVINAAAYTAVDKAESEQDAATKTNSIGPKNLAEACAKHNSYLLHISTDFVFDGQSNTAYPSTHKRAPLGVYGRTKADGEIAIEQSQLNKWAIIRTAWVYSSHGNNFVKTMLRLMAEKPELSVVADQIGTPTWAHGLAKTCWSALDEQLLGIHHWTDNGITSWYDFAVAIQRIALQHGLLDIKIPIKPIPAKNYPTPAQRPNFSALDKTSIIDASSDLNPKHWQEQLEEMLLELST